MSGEASRFEMELSDGARNEAEVHELSPSSDVEEDKDGLIKFEFNLIKSGLPQHVICCFVKGIHAKISCRTKYSIYVISH